MGTSSGSSAAGRSASLGKVGRQDEDRGASLFLRVALFLAAGTSGAALLAKVYGVTSLRAATFVLAVPCSVALLVAWVWSLRWHRDDLATRLTLGFTGGLLGTLAYDLARVPFHVSGLRVFAPISAYGVWINEAPMSSGLTEFTGWAYHFSNGITFGIMYALFMTRRAWGWAIVWGLILETIALMSPFGRIFSMTGNWSAISIAYAGHVAYGIPLGLMAQHPDEVRAWLRRISPLGKWAMTAVGFVALAWPLWSPAQADRDRRASPGEFVADGARLLPGWLRVQRGDAVRFRNPGPDSIAIRVQQRDVWVQAGQVITVTFPLTGVHQVFVETDAVSRSSFVIVDPVEAKP